MLSPATRAALTRLLEEHERVGQRAHDPTFRLFDRTYGPDPVACDFVFVSAGLVPRLQRLWVDGRTQASDHQPVALQLG